LAPTILRDYESTYTFLYITTSASKTLFDTVCIQLELEKVKKRRLEREREKEERDREQEMMQREKEIEYFREWEKQEDSVCFHQAVS